MIHDFDRSRWFGASDVRFIFASNRSTKSWAEWWSEKLGDNTRNFSTIYTRAGTIYEHPILEAIDPDIIPDGQILMERYRLRINYDGYKDGNIVEVKTYKDEDEFEEPTRYSKGKYLDYWRQCQVQMFVYQKMADEWFLPPFESLHLAAYPLHVDEYYADEDDVTVDPNRIQFYEIRYDKDFIKTEFIPRIKELSRELTKALRKKGE